LCMLLHAIAKRLARRTYSKGNSVVCGDSFSHCRYGLQPFGPRRIRQ
jgi:hypothetical protein